MRTRTGLAVVLVALAALAVPAAVSAQTATVESTTPTSTTPTTTAPSTATETEPTTSQSTQSTAAAEKEPRSNLLAYATLAFGLLLGGSLLHYLRKIQGRYLKTELALARITGVTAPATDVNTFSGGDAQKLTADASTDGPKLEIIGPSPTPVGTGAVYAVKAIAPGKALSCVTWALVPDSAGKIDPASGEKTTLTPTLAGILDLTVTATIDTDEPTSFTRKVIVQAPTSGLAPLPWVGEGFGTVLLTIAMITVVGVLGLTDVLPSDVIATLFGALAGYFFLRSTTETAPAAPAAAPTPTAPTPPA